MPALPRARTPLAHRLITCDLVSCGADDAQTILAIAMQSTVTTRSHAAMRSPIAILARSCVSISALAPVSRVLGALRQQAAGLVDSL